MRISPVNLKILAYTLDVEGFDSSGVLRHCGFEALDDIKEDGDWIGVELFDRMMAAALAHTGDPAFGLVAGKSLALMKYGAITPVVLSTPSLRQMLDDIRRFAVLTVERSEVELHEPGSRAQLLVQPVVAGGHSGHFRAEQVATSAMQMLRFAGAGSDDIHHVDLPLVPASGHERRYEAAFGPRINYGRRACVIGFNPALLDAPLPAHDPVAYLSACTRAESLLMARHARSNVADQVRQWLLRAFPQQPSVADTAVHLGMTERSLRRQLGALGITHAELSQECQRLTAQRLLAEGKQPLKQIAQSLGFATVHSFHRAFRRWHGETPLAWREGQRRAAS